MDLPTMATLTFTPEERLFSEAPGGAGYGDPLDRDPELVRLRARSGFISLERATNIYGVILETSSELYTVNYEATRKQREQLRNERNKKI